jgi:hypothetical protein|tara:strand:+ start:2411 stop:3124 length:714 start_codon:yes stop_codon:yes gene_type:complete
MATKRELIFTVMEGLKIQSDDTDVSQELISSLIDAARATTLKQMYGNKDWNLPIELRQEVCIELAPADSVDGATCLGKILRSTERLPKGISIKGGDGALLRVKRYDRQATQINIVPVERLPMIGHNTFTANMVYAAVDVDRYLYLVSANKKHMFMEAVRVDGVYESPELAAELKCKDGIFTSASAKVPDCEPWDEEYPLELALQDIVLGVVMKGLATRLQLPEDNINDSEDKRQEKA